MATENTTTPATTETEKPKASFAERCRAWHAAHDEYDRAIEAVEGRQDALGPRPTLPEILTLPLRAIDGTERQAPEAAARDIDRAWTTAELERIIEHSGFLEWQTVRGPFLFGTEYSVRPLADDVLATVRQMAEAARRFEADRKEHWDACTAIEHEAGEPYCEIIDSGIALMAEPLQRLADFKHKNQIIKRLFIFEGLQEQVEQAHESMLDNLVDLIEQAEA